MTYSRAIKKLCNKLMLAQTEFGETFGVSFVMVNRWEAGKFKPTTKLKRKLTHFLKSIEIKLMKSEALLWNY